MTEWANKQKGRQTDELMKDRQMVIQYYIKISYERNHNFYKRKQTSYSNKKVETDSLCYSFAFMR